MKTITRIHLALALCSSILCTTAFADTPENIDLKADASLAQLNEVIPAELLNSAAGLLIFPTLVQTGFGDDGEYGEGTLRVMGKTVSYYVVDAESLGLQVGAQKKTLILFFNSESALSGFREKDEWVAGTDGELKMYKPVSEDTETEYNQGITALLIDKSGPIHNVTLKGSRFSKVSK